MNCIIVDDEPLAREAMKLYLVFITIEQPKLIRNIRV